MGFYSTLTSDKLNGSYAFTNAFSRYYLPKIKNNAGYGCLFGIKFYSYNTEIAYFGTNYKTEFKNQTSHNAHDWHINWNNKFCLRERNRTQPYLFTGLGLERIKITESAYFRDEKKARDALYNGLDIEVGIGLRYYLSEKVTIRSELSYKSTGFTGVDGSEFNEPLYTNSFKFLLGTNYNFGKL
ncbi:MAG: hypothetical protein JXA60_03040 [Candidatus Coatesbacteria bacterium]|nr:hypothetical protein [Candidatus Coatesbacteria bacterium]